MGRWLLPGVLLLTIASVPRAQQPAPSAMWVWTSTAILDDTAARESLFAFSGERGIRELWMQVTTGRPAGRSTAPLAVTHADAWRALLSAAHARGLQVHALDGDPVYALKAFHEIPLQIADAVLAFNRSAPPGSRFDGLHFDNEPYLLPAWHDGESRERVLRDYLDLAVEIQRRVRTQPPMTFGVDVPFWWHHREGGTTSVTWGGRRQSTARHLLDLVDVVTLMNYRNSAAGPDGLVALASGMLADADRVGRAVVRVGVETSVMRPERVWLAVGAGGPAAARTLRESWRRTLPGNPYPLRVFDDGARVHIGVPLADAAAEVPEALVSLARRFGVRASRDTAAVEARAVELLGRSPEWRDPQPSVIIDPDTAIAYRGILVTSVPLQKITFASRPEAMAQELAAAEESFRRAARYAGLAVHHYDAYRALLAR